MVKNFSSHPHNLSHGRIHTLVTHSLSHTSVLNLLLDSLIFALLGSAVKKAKGHRYVWMLYLSGSLAGGLTSVIFKERSPVITPTIGSSSCVASYLSFLCLLNPRATIVLLGIPIKSWILVASMGTFSLLFDREKQSIAGITAGMVILQMMRARFI